MPLIGVALATAEFGAFDDAVLSLTVHHHFKINDY
jgi:hypothetical protein